MLMLRNSTRRSTSPYGNANVANEEAVYLDLSISTGPPSQIALSYEMIVTLEL